MKEDKCKEKILDCKEKTLDTRRGLLYDITGEKNGWNF